MTENTTDDNTKHNNSGAGMNPRDLVRISRRLSLVLRHRPQSVGIALDPAGWVAVDTLLAALAAHGTRISRAELDAVVAGNDKQRFAFDPSGAGIRASQGHTVPVDLGYTPLPPPAVLYHGTVSASIDPILRTGLRPGRRHDVHLSADVRTAEKVGARRGRPIILEIDAARMAADGHEFRRSANGVWLAAAVPAEYVRLL
jgi:putative RNA 2'-phosphotransferase